MPKQILFVQVITKDIRELAISHKTTPDRGARGNCNNNTMSSSGNLPHNYNRTGVSFMSHC